MSLSNKIWISQPMNDKKSTLTMSPAAWGMLILLSIVWGGTFFFQEIAVRELPVFTIVAIRAVLAASILYAILLAAARRMAYKILAARTARIATMVKTGSSRTAIS